MAQPTAPLTFEDLRREEVTAYDVTFTPEQARRIVKTSIGADVNFRKLSEDTRMNATVEAMKDGLWNWTDADPIRLHHLETGELVASDGQHRLWAAAIARRNLRSLVLFGDQWKSGLHVDKNRTRNVAQFLQHEYNVKNAATLVALARFHLSRLLAYYAKTSSAYQRNKVGDELIIAFVVDRIQDLEWAMNRYSIGSARGFNSIGYGCLLFEVREISHETAEAFHADMKDPDLDMLDPLAQLRRAVSANFARSGLRAHRDYTITNLVRAYNLREEGATLTRWDNVRSEDVYFPAGYKVPDKLNPGGPQ